IEAIYKRQVVSISCIATGISLLGTLCVAFYCWNKRRREKLHTHVKESRIQKNYTNHTSSHMTQSVLKTQYSLQIHKWSICYLKYVDVDFHCANSSFYHTSEQRAGAAQRCAARKNSPGSRGRLNPVGGHRDSGPAYHHLKEVEAPEKSAETFRDYLQKDCFLNMQPPLSALEGMQGSKTEVRCSCLDKAAPRSSSCSPSYQAPRVACRAGSIPIIPSFQGHHSDSSCMQMGDAVRSSFCTAALSDTVLRNSRHPSSSSSSSSSSLTRGGKQDAVALLLEEAQEQLRVLSHAQRRQEDVALYPAARETACFLGPVGAGISYRAEIRLVSPRGAQQPCK
ncbi:pro-neuregulin-3, membrane-bound-like, partial [Scleropages formosus]